MQVGVKWLPIAILIVATTAGCTSTGSDETAGGDADATQGEAKISAADTVWSEASAEGLTWDVPGSFKPVVPSTSMRLAEYELPTTAKKVRPGELSLIFFGPGVGGSAPGNLDQWIDQFRQPDRKESKERAVVDSFKVESGLKVTTIRLTGIYEPPSMNDKPGFDFPGWVLYGACIEGEGGPWFFRAVGPEVVIRRYMPALDKLYRGVRPAS